MVEDPLVVTTLLPTYNRLLALQSVTGLLLANLRSPWLKALPN